MARFQKTRYPNVFFRGEVLYCRLKDERGRWKQVRYGEGTPKKAFLWREQAQERADAVRRGEIDPRAEEVRRHATRPIEELIGEYEARLRAKGDGDMHVRETVRYCRRWAEACGVRRITDADPHRLLVWLDGGAWAARTRNAARAAVLGLCRWAASTHRAPYNPCPAGLVPKAHEDADRRRLSRAMDAEDFDRLIRPAPPHRKAFYLLAGCTGLRWREIARLRWRDLDLTGREVRIQAGQSKTGEAATLPLARRVVAGLRLHRMRSGGGPEADPVFGAQPRLRTWKRDLVRAGIIELIDPKLPSDRRHELANLAGYTDERGRRLDRKCLRMSFATWLRDRGVDVRDAQVLMRHADINMTAAVYTDTRLPGLRSAVEGLGR